jgi:hypothetical protein
MANAVEAPLKRTAVVSLSRCVERLRARLASGFGLPEAVIGFETRRADSRGRNSRREHLHEASSGDVKTDPRSVFMSPEILPKGNSPPLRNHTEAGLELPSWRFSRREFRFGVSRRRTVAPRRCQPRCRRDRAQWVRGPRRRWPRARRRRTHAGARSRCVASFPCDHGLRPRSRRPLIRRGAAVPPSPQVGYGCRHAAFP